MLEVPSRSRLTALTTAVNAVVPAINFGFTCQTDDAHASVLYVHSNGFVQLAVPLSDVPDVLLPRAHSVQQAVMRTTEADASGAVEWLLATAGVRQVVSTALSGREPRVGFWVGHAEPNQLTDEQLARLHAAAEASGYGLAVVVAPEESAEQSRRLELAADLLPSLMHVLDIREIFKRLSAAARKALPHDVLLLRVFSEDLSSISVYASSELDHQLGRVLPNVFPPTVTQAWEFDVIDHHERHQRKDNLAAAALGAKSSLRMSIRFGDRALGGIAFLSYEPARYSSADIAVGRRLANHVAVGLSHHRLADEERRAAALRERTANLEMLDGLLATLSGVLDIREVFDRVSAIAQKVLPHDALSIAEVLGNGERTRIHAHHGLGNLPEPFDIATPDRTMLSEPWDFRLIDDVLELPNFSESPGTKAGMRSMLFVSIRFEGRFFGGLNFYSRTPGYYTQDHVLVARRITDHVALALSHRRLAEEARRNDELRAQAEKADLLDELLAALITSGELRDVFSRISGITGKMLPHDAGALMVRLPDGRRARVYATAGLGPVPETGDVPEDLLQNPDWDHDIINDLSLRRQPPYVGMRELGFQSLLRVPIRLEGRFGGALLFLSRSLSAFTPAHIVVAKRIAERVAVTLPRERELEASKRADEATERAAKLEARVRALTDELDARTGYRRVVGESTQWRDVLKLATQVAATETTVLLLGQSGTGKEVVARFVHRASARNNGPFIALNCAALPEQLLEAELFGFERGAFTGATQSKPGQLEQAAGGTLFLDEVAEMSLPAQAKFLRVLQEREFQRLGGTRVLRTDARIVAATNRDLQRAIAQGQFREDLYYRLNVFAIRLPALRDRRDDVLPLSEAFLAEIGRGLGRPPAGISRDARQMLIDYQWPGNVRELRNILERAAILCDGGLITAEHLALNVAVPVAAPPKTAEPVAAIADSPLSAPSGDLQSMERAMIEQALQTARFNKSKAAKALGLTRHQLYIRMRKYGFE